MAHSRVPSTRTDRGVDPDDHLDPDAHPLDVLADLRPLPLGSPWERVAGLWSGPGRSRAQVMAAAVQHREARDLGAFVGETGHGFVAEARAWFGVAGVDASAPAVVAARLADAWGPRPPGVGATVRLWDQALALDALGPALPVRPPVPGRSRPPDP